MGQFPTGVSVKFNPALTPIIEREMLLSKKNCLLLYFLILVVCTLTFVAYIYNPLFTPDSWSYYELSNTMDSEFYKISTWRQYQYDNGYGVSFPPLWPFAIWTFNKIYNAEIYAGYYLNFIILILTLFSLIKLSTRISSVPFWGIFMFCSLITSSYYIDEIVSARSIPLTILLTIWLIYFITSDKIASKAIVSIGFLAGAMALNRFDFFLPGLLLGFLVFHLTKRKDHTGLYYLVFFLVISPWVIYSFTHFNTLFISDNTRTVLSSFYTNVNDYYHYKVPTLLDSPIHWLTKSIKNALNSSMGFLKA